MSDASTQQTDHVTAPGPATISCTEPWRRVTQLPPAVINASVSLADLMVHIDELHPRHLARTGIVSLRQLRLVSKELCNTAVVCGVKHCTVRLGAGEASPTPWQLSKHMAVANLESLEVYLTLTSGVCKEDAAL